MAAVWAFISVGLAAAILCIYAGLSLGMNVPIVVLGVLLGATVLFIGLDLRRKAKKEGG